jgi:multidrug efflux system outer membrane protein
VGALLSLPIFDGGRREAGVQGAQAQLDAALASYRGRCWWRSARWRTSCRRCGCCTSRPRRRPRGGVAARRATTLSDTRYRNGLVSQLELLDARRSELRNRRQALQVRSAQYQATVG